MGRVEDPSNLSTRCVKHFCLLDVDHNSIGTVTTRKTCLQNLSGVTLVAEMGLTEPYSLSISPKMWVLSKSTISQSKDTCKEQSWVFFHNRKVTLSALSFLYKADWMPLKGTNDIGRILRIVQDSDTACKKIIIHVFSLSASCALNLNMPILTPSDEGVVAVEPKVSVSKLSLTDY